MLKGSWGCSYLRHSVGVLKGPWGCSYLKEIFFLSGGGGLTKELIRTFGIHYVTQNNTLVHSNVQLFVTLRMFSTIVPNYMISVKHPCQFLRTLCETDLGGIKLYPSLPLALAYQILTR